MCLFRKSLTHVASQLSRDKIQISRLTSAENGLSMKLDYKTLLGLLLVIGAAQFLFVMMIGEGLAPGYSMHDNAISDLGVFNETALLFNASVLVLGVMNLVAGYMVYNVYGGRLLAAVFLVAGLAAVGVGLVPLDSKLGIHGIFALTAFVFVNIEVILASKVTKNPLRTMSILLGLVGLAFVAVMFMIDSDAADLSGSIGHGITERMIVFPGLFWMMIFGGYQLSQSDSRQKETDKI